jgi:Small-conductance mechanosensitive channel
MFVDGIKWLILLGTSLGLWIVGLSFPDENIQRMFVSVLLVSIIYLILIVIVKNIVIDTIKDSKTKYSFNKGIGGVFYLTAFIALGIIWVQNTQALLVSYGIVGAGIAIALQDVFKNFAGSIFIITSNLYTVGDRVEIDRKIGDVIDIGIWNTTLMETQGWVGGDQATGRITLIPNGQVIATPVFNYTKDLNFIWDEIRVPVTYQSDWKKAIHLFIDILNEQIGSGAIQAERRWKSWGPNTIWCEEDPNPRCMSVSPRIGWSSVSGMW